MNILATGMGWIEHTPGGLNRYFADYLQAMTQYGHTVTGLMTANGERTGAPAYMKDVVPAPAKLGTWSRTRAFRQVVRSHIGRSRPDVFNPHFALYSSLVTRNLLPATIPIVTHFHGPWAQESLVEDHGGRKLGLQLRYRMKKEIELLSYRRADHFIVLSHYFYDILSSDYGIAREHIHIIPGAVDTERFKPADDRAQVRASLGLSDASKVLFCARRLVHRMGIDHLIRAMVDVAKQVPDALLYIAGSGPMRKQLEEQIRELGLGSVVHLLGRVPNEDLVRWYQAADLSIVPTLELEGFGLVTVEALACGTPVLGTPYGGTHEILERFSPNLLFRDSSPQAMSERISSVLLGHTDVPSRDACLDYVLQHYTWQRVAKAVTRVFEHANEERKGWGTR